MRQSLPTFCPLVFASSPPSRYYLISFTAFTWPPLFSGYFFAKSIAFFWYPHIFVRFKIVAYFLTPFIKESKKGGWTFGKINSSLKLHVSGEFCNFCRGGGGEKRKASSQYCRGIASPILKTATKPPYIQGSGAVVSFRSPLSGSNGMLGELTRVASLIQYWIKSLKNLQPHYAYLIIKGAPTQTSMCNDSYFCEPSLNSEAETLPPFLRTPTLNNGQVVRKGLLAGLPRPSDKALPMHPLVFWGSL